MLTCETIASSVKNREPLTHGGVKRLAKSVSNVAVVVVVGVTVVVTVVVKSRGHVSISETYTTLPTYIFCNAWNAS